MSIPRDLKVTIPGAGTDKINAAYEIGGPRKTVATIKRLFSDRHRRRLRDQPHHQRQLRRLPAARSTTLGCVYVDIDRRYFNDNAGLAAGGYATIDIQPGLPEALRPARRSTTCASATATPTSSAPRASRTSCARPSSQDSVRKLLDFGQRTSSRKIFGRYFEVDKSLRCRPANVLRLLQHRALPGAVARAGRARSTSRRTRAATRRSTRTSTSTAPTLRKTLDAFMSGRRRPSRRPRRRRRRSARRARSQASQSTSAPHDAVVDQRAGATTAPTARTWPCRSSPAASSASRSTSRRCAPPGAPTPHRRSRASTTIPDEATRSTPPTGWSSTTGVYGEYYGVQGMSWKLPADPRQPERVPAPSAAAG